ncbi:MAG: LuxR C-terminal-related transcriptional regulator [Anaerolineales bacterium]
MPKSALPAELTPLLGRDAEAARLHESLRRPDGAPRLITITGPGGVGKTSLAVRVAHQAQDSFADGVLFISLAPISDSTLVLPTIAQALNLPESPRTLWLDSLKDYLHDRQVLLLLDNFEQIISAAPLLTELLLACGGLRLLVTSREALRLRGEQEFHLLPLPLPDRPVLEALRASPSIALFVQRAQAFQLDFQLTAQNAAAVAEICARLDGLPLAIELAAARIRLLPPSAILAQLRASPLQLLSHGPRDLPERQQTLRHAVRWSYDLLDADEQRAFRWLSMFVGGSTLEAALAVIGPPASVDILESLVSKSLLRQSETDGAARLLMLETIRQFGLEQLSSAREVDLARRAHALHYLSFAEAAESELTGPDQKIWLQRLNREQDNLRAALRWAIEQRDGATAQRLAGALQPFWLTRGHWSEGRRWLEDALALDDPARVLAMPGCGSGGPAAEMARAKALYGAALLARFQGDFARARMLCDQSLTLYRGLADPTGVVEALVELSRISSFQGDQTAKQVFLTEAAARLESLPDTVVKASAYSELVIALVTPGALQYPLLAARYLAESERIQRALNNPTGLALVLIRQASGALFGVANSTAASQLDEAERLATELGDERILSRLVGIRVLFDWQAGDFTAARLRLQDTFPQLAGRGDHQLSTWLPMLAIVLHGQGLEVWSARVFGLVEAMTALRPTSAETAALWQSVGLNDLRAEVRAQLGDEAFARELAAGQRLTLDDLRTIPHPPGPAGAPAAVSPATPGAALTPREIEVLRLLDLDLSNPQIAERLVVSRRTVDAHLRSIYDKLGVKTRAAAIRAAHAHGMLNR